MVAAGFVGSVRPTNTAMHRTSANQTLDANRIAWGFSAGPMVVVAYVVGVQTVKSVVVPGSVFRLMDALRIARENSVVLMAAAGAVVRAIQPNSAAQTLRV